jgi:hypothetical protein
MSNDVLKNINYKYCPRFGQIAVEMGFISEDQLMEAFRIQFEKELSGQGHSLVGHILLDKEWVTSSQVERVLNTLYKRMSTEEGRETNGNEVAVEAGVANQK